MNTSHPSVQATIGTVSSCHQECSPPLPPGYPVRASKHGTSSFSTCAAYCALQCLQSCYLHPPVSLPISSTFLTITALTRDVTLQGEKLSGDVLLWMVQLAVTPHS